MGIGLASDEGSELNSQSSSAKPAHRLLAAFAVLPVGTFRSVQDQDRAGRLGGGDSPPPDSVPGRSLIAFCQAHDLLRFSCTRRALGFSPRSSLGRRMFAFRLGGSKWCAWSMPHSRERSHPRRASRLDAFRRAAGQQCILVLRITPSWPPGRACWWCS